MKKILFILLSFGLAAEMEVDGGLSVTEGVTAASFAGNGSGLSGIGIKPERIYSFKSPSVTSDHNFSFTVPSNKMWILFNTREEEILIDNQPIYVGGGSPTCLLPFQTISDYGSGDINITIYEYPISGSGTDQGMNYVEP